MEMHWCSPRGLSAGARETGAGGALGEESLAHNGGETVKADRADDGGAEHGWMCVWLLVVVVGWKSNLF